MTSFSSGLAFKPLQLHTGGNWAWSPDSKMSLEFRAAWALPIICVNLYITRFRIKQVSIDISSITITSAWSKIWNRGLVGERIERTLPFLGMQKALWTVVADLLRFTAAAPVVRKQNSLTCGAPAMRQISCKKRLTCTRGAGKYVQPFGILEF